jgi:hypothetical protein
MVALSPDKENVIKGDGYSVKIPGKCLLDSVFINYSFTPPVSQGIYSNVLKVGESYDLLGFYSVSIRPNGLPADLRDKALIMWHSAGGGSSAKGGKWDGDMLTVQAREFGSFFIMIDTTPPKITPINVMKGKNMRLIKNITVQVRDYLSGLRDYHAYIDGKWELMEMDGKTSVLKMALPKDLSAGEHVFKLVAIDDRNNTSEYSVHFNY